MTLHWVGPRTPDDLPAAPATDAQGGGTGEATRAVARPRALARRGAEGARGRPREPGQPPTTSYSRDPGRPGLYLGAGGHHVVYELACFIMVCSML